MGGKGSGRPPSIKTLLNKNKAEQRTPIATEMYIPNLSGDHSAGKVLSTPSNKKDIVNKEYVDSVSVNTGVDLFGYKEDSDVEGYYTMKPDIDGTAKETVSDTIPGKTDNYLIGSFITESSYDAYALIRILTRGVYEMHAHLKAGSSGRLKFYGEFYVRDSEGSETLLGTTELTDFVSNTEEEYNFHLTLSEEYPLSDGDRIAVKVYANNSHPADTDIDIYMEGTTGTRVEVKGVSFQRQHNSLANLDYASAGHTGFQQTLTAGTGITLTDSTLSTDDSAINHNALTNFVANQHIDWTNASSNFSTSGTLAAGAATITGNQTISGNLQVNGGYIGISTDTNLLTLTANVLTLSGQFLVITSAFPQIRANDGTRRLDMGFSGDAYFWKKRENTGSLIFRREDNYNALVLDLENKNVGIGTTPATSGALDISSTTGALIVPRMTTTQRNAMTAVAGMIIFNTTTNRHEGYDGSSWDQLNYTA